MSGVFGGQLEILSADDVYRIHQNAMRILEYIGVKVHEPAAFNLLKDAGAEVDEKSRVVRIPEYLVKDMIKKAPSGFILYARSSKYDVHIEKRRVFYGPMIGRKNILDLKTGERRPTNAIDVVDLMRLADALQTYRLIHSGAVMPHIEGVPDEIVHVQGYYISAKNCSKVIKATARGKQRAKDCLRMAAVLAGGEEELRKKPMVFTTVNSISPLQHSRELTEGLLEYAKLKQPVDITTEIQAGATGPVTLAGSLAQQSAEVLSGIVIAQLVSPGTPVFYGTCSTIMDMKFGTIALGAIEAALFMVASAQIARFYDLPCRGTAGNTDSKLIDVQSGYEKALGLALGALAGANYLWYPGTIESGATISLEQMVIDDEICAMVSRFIEGIDVNSETLAFDVIRAVGHGGQFLGQKHTMRFLEREQYLPRLSDRKTRESWLKEGGKDLCAVAREKTEKILREHQVEPLDPSMEKKMLMVIEEVKKREMKS